MSVEGFFKPSFQVFDSTYESKFDVGPGRQIKHHTFLNIFKAKDLFGIQVGEQPVQLMDAFNDAGQG